MAWGEGGSVIKSCSLFLLESKGSWGKMGGFHCLFKCKCINVGSFWQDNIYLRKVHHCWLENSAKLVIYIDYQVDWNMSSNFANFFSGRSHQQGREVGAYHNCHKHCILLGGQIISSQRLSEIFMDFLFTPFILDFPPRYFTQTNCGRGTLTASW